MDLETENRLAALLMEEARRLRAQSEKEGVGVYLRQPNVRGRPNSRFLTATVLGVEQANRAVEVNEMWRAREKEWELDAKLKTRAKDKDVCYGDENRGDPREKISSSRHEDKSCRSAYVSSSKRGHDDDTCYSSDDGGLRDDEVEEFLRSRAKRGRGAIGSKMDEAGPYPSATSSDHDTGKLLTDPDAREKEEWEHRILGPEKPSFIKSHKLPPERVEDTVSSKKEHHFKEEEEEEKKKKKRSYEEGRSKRKKSLDKEKKKRKHRHHKSRRSRSDSE